MDIVNTIPSFLQRGSRGVLATVVRRTGFAPRDVGAKMLVTDKGKVFGTVGAGHVSWHLSKIANAAGFSVTVIDDRKEFANIERFSEADAIVTGQFRDAFSSLDFTGNEYVAVLTRSQEHDALVLEEVLKKDVRYIGMMGSTRKVGIILNSLHEKGLGREGTSRVHAPIGIDIEAETPQEVAVSIVAEMIKVKNAKH